MTNRKESYEAVISDLAKELDGLAFGATQARAQIRTLASELDELLGAYSLSERAYSERAIACDALAQITGTHVHDGPAFPQLDPSHELRIAIIDFLAREGLTP